MDLQLKIFFIMIILLVASYVVAEILTSVYESKTLGDILGDIMVAQCVVYVLIQAFWSVLRLWNY